MRYEVNPSFIPGQLEELFRAAWPDGDKGDCGRVLRHSLADVAAFDDERMVGFINVTWDGGAHAFLVDTTVHPDYRRHSIGTSLVQRATEGARAAGCSWLHADWEETYATFYERCGFSRTNAGLIRL